MVVGHAEKEKKRTKQKQDSFGHGRAEEKRFGWSKVKVSGLHWLWFDEKSMKGRKEEKVKEIKGKGHSAIWAEREKEWSPRVWVLSAAWVRASKKRIEK